VAHRLGFLKSPFKPDVRVFPDGTLCNSDAARIILTGQRDSLKTCQVDIIYGVAAGNEAAPSRSGTGWHRRRSVNEGREELDVISRMDSLTNRAVIGAEGLRAGLVWIEDRFSHSPAAGRMPTGRDCQP
jgi:hypothetical protein